MNFRDTRNCISSNGCVANCVLKWNKIAPYFMRKEAKATKAITK